MRIEERKFSIGEETGSDVTPDEEKSSGKSSDINGKDEENISEEVFMSSPQFISEEFSV